MISWNGLRWEENGQYPIRDCKFNVIGDSNRTLALVHGPFLIWGIENNPSFSLCKLHIGVWGMMSIKWIISFLHGFLDVVFVVVPLVSSRQQNKIKFHHIVSRFLKICVLSWGHHFQSWGIFHLMASLVAGKTQSSTLTPLSQRMNLHLNTWQDVGISL